MALTWVSANMVTGRIIADLNGLACDYPLRRSIGRYETATAHLHLDDAPLDWEYAVREGATVLAAYDEDDPTRAIQWAGFVTQQTRSTASNVVDLSLATMEAYFDRRFVSSAKLVFVGIPQSTIMEQLIMYFLADRPGTVLRGIPITVSHTNPNNLGTLRNRTYYDADSATVYARLTQLMATLGGPEFTVEWQWSADKLRLTPNVIVGRRLGRAVTPDRQARATFEHPGCVIEAVQVRDYSAGKGANVVTAYSSGQGNATPTSGPLFLPNDGRPLFEFRWTPSSSITDKATLIDYAKQAGAILAPGARSLVLTANRADAPTLGVDWQLGDDVGYVLGGVVVNDAGDEVETAPAFPGGLTGLGRVIAYELTEDTITPILAEAAVYTDESETA